MRIGVLGIKLSDPGATVMRMIRFMRAIGAGTAAVAMLISGATAASAQGQGSISADSLGGTPGSSSLASVDVFGSLGSLAGNTVMYLGASWINQLISKENPYYWHIKIVGLVALVAVIMIIERYYRALKKRVMSSNAPENSKS